MIRFVVDSLLKNKVLWAWPGLFLLFAGGIFIYGDITAAPGSASFMINMEGLNLPPSMVINQLISLTTLIVIIGLPTHFAKNIESERASLLLSKPVSRSEFFLSDFAATIGVTFLYTLATILVLAILIGIKAALFPFQFFAGLFLFLPLLLLTYYITITLFLILTNSYLSGVIIGYFTTELLSSLFMNGEVILNMLGYQSDFAHGVFDVLSYLIPSSAAVEQILAGILQSGFTDFDGGLLAFSLASCLPFFALGYYFFLRKEF